MKIKTDRINSELKRKISEIIAASIKDPRLEGAIVGVTKINVTPDLKYAKAYLSVYAENDDKKKEAYETVVRSKSFIRNRLKEEMQIRLIPDISYFIDDSAEYGAKIEGILRTIEIPPEERE